MNECHVANGEDRQVKNNKWIMKKSMVNSIDEYAWTHTLSIWLSETSSGNFPSNSKQVAVRRDDSSQFWSLAHKNYCTHLYLSSRHTDTHNSCFVCQYQHKLTSPNKTILLWHWYQLFSTNWHGLRQYNEWISTIQLMQSLFYRPVNNLIAQMFQRLVRRRR